MSFFDNEEDMMEPIKAELDQVRAVGERRVSEMKTELNRLLNHFYDSLESGEADVISSITTVHQHLAYVIDICQKVEIDFCKSLIQKRLEMTSIHRKEIDALFETHRELEETALLSEILELDSRNRSESSSFYQAHCAHVNEKIRNLLKEDHCVSSELETLKSEDSLKLSKLKHQVAKLANQLEERKRYTRTIKHRLINLRGTKFHLAEEYSRLSVAHEKENQKVTKDILRLTRQYENDLRKLSAVEAINAKKLADVRSACEDEIREQADTVAQGIASIYLELFATPAPEFVAATTQTNETDERFWYRMSHRVPEDTIVELSEIATQLEENFSLLVRAKAAQDRLTKSEREIEMLKETLQAMTQKDYHLIAPPVLDESIKSLIA